MTESFLQIYLKGSCVADILTEPKILRHIYRKRQLKQKYDNFYIGVDKTIKPGENLMWDQER